MARRKKEEKKGGAPEYMLTYGDMVTLLLTFFVLLYSMSNLDEQKVVLLAEAFAGRPIIITGGLGDNLTGQGPSIIDQMPQHEEDIAEGLGSGGDETRDPEIVQIGQDEYDRLMAIQEAMAELTSMESDFRTYLAQHYYTDSQGEFIEGGVVLVEVVDDYLLVRFDDTLLFASGRAELNLGALEVLNFLVDELLKHPGHSIRVEGHTDTVPIGTAQFPSNRHLSAARASTVAEYLSTRGLDPRLITAEGMSEYHPVASNDTEEGRAQNRRVEIKIYGRQEGIQTFTIPLD